ncbi:hypothetical protein DV735_g814, partial [Chaetothyriales sp. CBS 134920]
MQTPMRPGISLSYFSTANSTSNGTSPTPPIKWTDQFLKDNQRDFWVQMVISVAFGSTAFLAFCLLRPRWSTLYLARKKQSNAASRLPELPDSLFGWIPVVYGISEEEVLASAGLDAYAFLAFFRYATKYLVVTLVFCITIILPINARYTGELPFSWPGRNVSDPDQILAFARLALDGDKTHEPQEPGKKHKGYLWMYTIFAYIFSFVAIYLLIQETRRIIKIRQACLGSQSTITDRTFRLSGIPINMRSEARIRDFIEDLQIGKVNSVALCRDSRKLDNLMDQRKLCLGQLEAAWTRYIGQRASRRQTHRPRRYPRENGDIIEGTALLSGSEIEATHVDNLVHDRPKRTIRYGPLKLRSRSVDAIDYYDEKLRRLDEQITLLRTGQFPPTALAFVTMESTAACQMAVQAILDPNPGTFIASLAPSPAHVVWKNTYLSRKSRLIRSWSVTIFIGFLTIFWAVLLVPLALLLRIETLDEIFPGFSDSLDQHGIGKSLISSGLPTLIFSLLSVLVPFLYAWLAHQQGMTSRGDIELSVISKNFFFTFFNLFVVFSIFGSASTFLEFWQDFKDLIKDTGLIAYTIAKSLETLSPFYLNLIVLQAFGFFPFRLLEFGAVALYPVWLLNAQTPRDYANLTKPPVFTYGFHLPQSMLIFVICIVYSLLPKSWTIILIGLIYFRIGAFIYKYQLLYAMDHRQHSSGRVWPMICKRVFLGLVIFQIAMTGYIALRAAYTASLALIPLVLTTIWVSIYFQRTFDPLMYFIALRSIDKVAQSPPLSPPDSPTSDPSPDSAYPADSTTKTDLRYINPNIISPLEPPWVRKPVGLDLEPDV